MTQRTGDVKVDEIEAVAKAMHEHLHKDGGPPWGIWSAMFPNDAQRVRDLARAAIEAYLAQAGSQP